MNTLLELGITSKMREEVIMQITHTDYSEGPLEDTLNKGSDMWVFGKNIGTKEIYIKISLGDINNKTICISFHIAEKPIIYPFK